MGRLASSGLKFLIVGGVSTLIELMAFNLLVYGLGIAPVPAKVIASLVALVNAYAGNRGWTFSGRKGHGAAREVVLFLLVNAVCTAIGAAIVALGSGLIPSAGPLALNLVNIVSVGIVVVVRFVSYHFVVFPEERGASPGGHRP